MKASSVRIMLAAVVIALSFTLPKPLNAMQFISGAALLVAAIALKKGETKP